MEDQLKVIIPPDEIIPEMYETYRNEEDLSAESYYECDEEKQKRLFINMKRFFRAAYIGNDYAGWLTIIHREESLRINVGFYLNPEFRRKGLMVKFLNIHCDELKKIDTDKQITAGTKFTNISAYKTLERS